MGKKQSWRPGTMIYPLPAVLVTCGSVPERYNMLTVAWTGTICSDPAMCYISVRTSRHSYDIIKEEMEFTINLTTSDMARATDWAGVRSGRDYDKWNESPLSIECRVKEIMHLGTHDMFIAEVVNVLADESLIDAESGAFDLAKAGLMAYSHGAYYELGRRIGKFGWSVKKNK